MLLSSRNEILILIVGKFDELSVESRPTSVGDDFNLHLFCFEIIFFRDNQDIETKTVCRAKDNAIRINFSELLIHKHFERCHFLL